MPLGSPSVMRRKSDPDADSQESVSFPTLCCWQKSSKKGIHDAYPPEELGCTDILFLVLFVIFCLFMLLIAVFACIYGNPYRLVNGVDSFGNVCGMQNEEIGNMNFSGMDLTMKPFVLYFNITKMDRTTKICVERCPDRKLESYKDIEIFYRETNVSLCRYDYDFDTEQSKSDPFVRKVKTSDSNWDKFENPYCPALPYYTSLPILKRCIPKPSKSLRNKVLYNAYEYLNNLDVFKQVLGDVAVTWKSVLGLTTISFAISFLIVIMIHWITALMSYIIMIFTSAICIALTGFLWWTYAGIASSLEHQPLGQTLEESIRNESAFLTYSILATIFTILLVAVTIFLRDKVAIVVQLFREAGSALRSMPCLVFQPILTYCILSLFFCGWLYVLLCLATADFPTQRHVTQDASLDTAPQRIGSTVIKFDDPVWVKYMWWIYIVGLIWCSEFILACQQMVIASSVAAWYFSRDRSSLRCVIVEAVFRLLKHHLGSVALGSALITLVKIPRLALSFSDRVLRTFEDSWPFVKYLKRGCICCLQFFEKFLKYIHHNAYTVIAIQGVNFCPASRLAFNGLVLNALQVSVINSTGDFLLFLAKCLTAALTGLIALAVFRADETLYFYAIPVLLTVVFSYFVAHCVVSVFEMAVDTLFLCFCEDHNINDGTDGKPYYAPPSLFKFMTEDAVDAVAPGRRTGTRNNRKSKEIELMSKPEESIPINTSIA